MSKKGCLFHIDANGVATLTLNRPERHNALNAEMIERLHMVMQRAEGHDVRVLVIVAEGKSFCAGADIQWMKESAEYAADQNLAEARKLADLLLKLNSLPKPVVAQVQGDAYGGGIGLLACCDIVLAADKASFCFSEVKLGLIPAVIAPYVVNAIGPRATRRYFLSAESFSAQEALHLGLVHEVVPRTDLRSRVDQLTDQLRVGGPNAQAAAKQLIEKVAATVPSEALAAETAQMIALIRASAEGVEGLSAFLEKRLPGWRGRSDV
ncbi:MAG: enoyl-CoA hydratase/isomerase family protein [Pseudomonadota bacterium]